MDIQLVSTFSVITNITTDISVLQPLTLSAIISLKKISENSIVGSNIKKVTYRQILSENSWLLYIIMRLCAQ